MIQSKLKVFIFIFLVVQLFTWLITNFYLDPNQQMEFIKKASISFGTGLGVTLTLYTCYLWLLQASSKVTHTNTYVISGIVFTLIALPFGLIIGIIGGGTFGGAWGSVIFEFLGFNQMLGISIGIGFGIFIAAIIPTLLGTIIGFTIGKALRNSQWLKNV